MPKSNLRRKNMEKRVGPGIDAFQTSMANGNLLFTPPRKVSFEDSRNDSNLSICSNDAIPTKTRNTTTSDETTQSEKEKRSIRRKRSLLVRPITSLSLVDLAKSVEYDASSPLKSELMDEDDIGSRDAKRIRSFNLSPRSVLQTSELSGGSRHASPRRESKALRTSPWGHFIDMSPDDHSYSSLFTTPHQNYEYKPKNQEKQSLGRTRRRPTPYGQFKRYARQEQEHPTLSFFVTGLKTDTNSGKPDHKFLLSPRNADRSRRSAADELVGVFSELKVRQAAQESSTI